jgi:hypothetical protein
MRFLMCVRAVWRSGGGAGSLSVLYAMGRAQVREASRRIASAFAPPRHCCSSHQACRNPHPHPHSQLSLSTCMLLKRITATPLSHPWPWGRIPLTRSCDHHHHHHHHHHLLLRHSHSHSHSPSSPLLANPSQPHHSNAHAANMAQGDEQPQWGAARVRQTFLDYFANKGHTFGTFDFHSMPTVERSS